MHTGASATLRGLAVVLGAFLGGCQMHDVLKPEQMRDSGGEIRVLSIELNNGQTIRFDRDSLGLAVFQDSAVSRFLPNGGREVYNLGSIARIHTIRPSTTAEDVSMVFLVGGIAFLLVLISMSRIVWRFG